MQSVLGGNRSATTADHGSLAPLGVCTMTIRLHHRSGVRGSLDSGDRTRGDRGSVIARTRRSAWRIARLSATIRRGALPCSAGSRASGARAWPLLGSTFDDQPLHRRIEVQQTQGARHHRPRAPGCVGHVFVREVETLDETHQRPRLVNRVEIFAPTVVEDRHRDGLPVAQIAHHCGRPLNPLYPCSFHATRALPRQHPPAPKRCLDAGVWLHERMRSYAYARVRAYGFTVMQSCGHAVMRLYGHAVIGSCGHRVISLCAHRVMRSCVHTVIPLCAYTFVRLHAYRRMTA